MHARFVAVLLGAVAVAVVACSGNDEPAATPAPPTDAGADAEQPTVTKEACQARCSTKAISCQVPTIACRQLCGAGSITETQAQCIETQPCPNLIGAALQGGTVDEICARAAAAAASEAGTLDGLPASMTITGPIAGQTPKHIDVSGKVVSQLDIAVVPVFSPQLPPNQIPQIAVAKSSVTVVAPSPAKCALAFTFALNAGQLTVHMEGTDDAAGGDCATFIANAAKGTTLKLANVPWLNSATTATVTIDLK